MKDKYNQSYPSETSYLTNPIVSGTEATGCALRIAKKNGITVSQSAPVKGTKLPGYNPKKEPR